MSAPLRAAVAKIAVMLAVVFGTIVADGIKTGSTSP
jgi:hypothetical protein